LYAGTYGIRSSIFQSGGISQQQRRFTSTQTSNPLGRLRRRFWPQDKFVSVITSPLSYAARTSIRADTFDALETETQQSLAGFSFCVRLELVKVCANTLLTIRGSLNDSVFMVRWEFLAIIRSIAMTFIESML
jgi:hypothetical protein